MPDWDDKPPEERDTYGSAWVTEADSVDARGTEEFAEEVVEEQTKPLSLWADSWRRLKRNRVALVGLGIIIVFLTVGMVETIFYQAHWHVRASSEATASDAAGYLAPYDPNMVNYALSPGGLGSPPSLVAPVRHRLSRA